MVKTLMQDAKLSGAVIMIAALATIAALFLVSHFTIIRYEESIRPLVHNETATVGKAVGQLIAKAVDYGIPFSEIRGINEYLESVLQTNPKISYIRIKGVGGKEYFQGSSNTRQTGGQQSAGLAPAVEIGETYEVGNYYETRVRIIGAGGVIGSVYLGQEKGFVKQILEDISNDIITVLIVTLLMAYELLNFIVSYSITAPLRMINSVLKNSNNSDYSRKTGVVRRDEIGRVSALIDKNIEEINLLYSSIVNRLNILSQGSGETKGLTRLKHELDRVNQKNIFSDAGTAIKGLSTELLQYIRPPLFLIIFSESLSLSFFPLYVGQVYQPVDWVSKELVIGLPISLFMFIWAVSMPYSGAWSDRVGRRRSFIVGALTTAIGLFLTGMSQNMLQLLILRSITAVGYGIVFIACQGFVSERTDTSNRTKAMAMFLSAFFSGSLCGAAIGGILADRIGYENVFFLSSILSILAAIFVFRFLAPATKVVKKGEDASTIKKIRLVLSNRRILLLTVCAAIPAKISLTGFLYYTAPLYLKYQGVDQSTTGRVMMAYGIAIIVFSPIVAKISDVLGRRYFYIVVGGLLSSASLILLHLYDFKQGMFVSILVLGLAHAIGVPSQLSLVTELSKKEQQTIGPGAVIGVFRLLERIGNVLGPLIAGAAIAAYGYSDAFLAIGLLTFVGIIIYVGGNAYYDIRTAERRDSNEPNLAKLAMQSLAPMTVGLLVMSAILLPGYYQGRIKQSITEYFKQVSSVIAPLEVNAEELNPNIAGRLLELRDVRISNLENCKEPSLVYIPTVRVEFDSYLWWAKKHVVIQSLEIISPSISYESGCGKGSNLYTVHRNGLVSKRNIEQGEEGVRTVSVNSFSISNAKVVEQDILQVGRKKITLMKDMTLENAKENDGVETKYLVPVLAETILDQAVVTIRDQNRNKGAKDSGSTSYKKELLKKLNEKTIFKRMKGFFGKHSDN